MSSAEVEPAGVRRRGPGVRPALLVVAIAAALVVGFGALALLTSSGTPRPAPPSHPTRVAGTPLRAVPARSALAPIERPGTPPNDIVDALTLPRGAVARSHDNVNTSSTQYDEQMRFSVRSSEGAVVDFYKAELKASGWSVLGVDPVRGHSHALQVLAQKGGSDGWYWEVGAIVSPTTFARGTSAESTAFTLRLIQEPDAQ